MTAFHLASYILGAVTTVAIEVVAAVLLWRRGVRWGPHV